MKTPSEKWRRRTRNVHTWQWTTAEKPAATCSSARYLWYRNIHSRIVHLISTKQLNV